MSLNIEISSQTFTRLWRNKLNSIYIVVGTIIIAVLMFLLIGPFFINWTGFRSTIEEYAEQALGQPVVVLGKSDIRLLPSPRLTFNDVQVGESENPLIVINSLSLVAELPPLLRGELKIREFILNEPELRLDIDEVGQLNWHKDQVDVDSVFDPSSVVLDEIVVNRGSVNIFDVRTGQNRSFTGLNFAGSADSLKGPFKANGEIFLAGIKHSVSLKTGKIGELGKINLIALLKPDGYSVQIDINGDYFSESGIPKFEGEFNLSSQVPQEQENIDELSIWNVVGKIDLDSLNVDINEIQIDYGPRDRSISFEGNIHRKFGQNSKFDLRLDSSQIDLDRLLGHGPSDPVATEFVVERLISIVENIPNSAGIGKVELNFPGIVVNGSIIQNVEIEATSTASGWKVEKFEAYPPGQTRLSTNGEILLETTIGYIGALEIQSSQPTTLFSWWQDNSSNFLTDYKSIDLTANIVLDSNQIEFKSINGQLGEDQISGNVAWDSNTNNRTQLIVADLELENLNFDQISSISQIFGAPSALSGAENTNEELSRELDLSLNLKQLNLAGILATDVEIEVGYKDGKFTIENLSSKKVQGSSIAITGELDNLVTLENGNLIINLESEDISNLFDSIQTIFPNNKLIQKATKNGEIYSPISLSANYNADSSTETHKRELNFKGTVANSEVESKIELIGETRNWREKKIDAEIQVKSVDGGILLRQFGFEGLPLRGLNPAEIYATFSGVLNDHLDSVLTIKMNGTELSTTGMVEVSDNFDFDYSVNLNLKSRDLTPFLENRQEILRWFEREIPIEVSTKFIESGSTLNIKEYKGSLLETEFQGSIFRKINDNNYEYSGSIKLSELDLQSLINLILGNESWGNRQNLVEIEQLIESLDDSFWSLQSFGIPILGDTVLELDVIADKFKFTEELIAQNVSAKLQIGPNQLALRNLKGEIDSGRITGDLVFRNSAGEVGVTGKVQLDKVPIDRYVWQFQNSPVVAGMLNLNFDIKGSGRSMASVIGSLTGGGTYEIKKGEISGLKSNSFDQVLVAVDEGLALEENSIIESFETLFDSSKVSFRNIEGNFAITAGKLQTRRIEFDLGDVNINLDADLDLQELSLLSEWTIRKDLPDKVVGAIPQIEVIFSGPIRNPDFDLNVTDFINYLTLRALDLETEKQDSQNAMILERERLFRELRQLKENIAIRQAAKTPVIPDSQEPIIDNEQEPVNSQEETPKESVTENFDDSEEDIDDSQSKIEFEKLIEQFYSSPQDSNPLDGENNLESAPESTNENTVTEETEEDLAQKIRESLENHPPSPIIPELQPPKIPEPQPPVIPKLQPGEFIESPLPPLN